MSRLKLCTNDLFSVTTEPADEFWINGYTYLAFWDREVFNDFLERKPEDIWEHLVDIGHCDMLLLLDGVHG